MIRLLQRPSVAAFLVCCFAWSLTTLAAGDDISWPVLPPTQSASGQFAVSVLPEPPAYAYRRPEAPTNAAFLRLQAPWLVVSAERFKVALRREIGISPSASWTGKIFLTLHSARSLDEPVVITPQPFVKVWNCRLDLPDMISRDRYARAMTASVLLELANRNTPVTARSAEVPAWLVDGLARQVVESAEVQAILSAPNKSVESASVTGSGPAKILGGIAQARINQDQRGLDPLATARRALQSSAALTFDQLSWPNDAQMNGDDGGVYFGSAQLFVDSLLDLKGGPEKIRSFLSQLSSCENWQTAFFRAFQENFRTPLEVEKWWALRVVAFVAREPGPRWTVAVSRQKLDELLTVPVGVRYASNSLPMRTEISLQSAIQTFGASQRNAILETKLRDLELTQLRLAPQLAVLADGYRGVLAEFLGERKRKAGSHVAPKRNIAKPSKATVAATLKNLDALDERRRAVEAGLDKQALPFRTP